MSVQGIFSNVTSNWQYVKTDTVIFLSLRYACYCCTLLLVLTGKGVFYCPKGENMAENISDGEYTIEAELSGGTGRAHITSPAKLTVTDGCMNAEIEWSSSTYDYMKVDGKEYYPQNDEGNSVFVVEIPQLDTDISVLAETVAMSEPHLIEYTLYFDSSTLRSENSTSGVILSCIIIGTVLIASATGLFIRKRKLNGKK